MRDRHERQQEPGRQWGCQRADRVGVERVDQVRVGGAEQQTVAHEEQHRQRPAERRPADDAGSRRVAWQVAGVVGGAVDPAHAEPGHEHHQRADHGGGAAGGRVERRAQVHLVERERDVAEREHERRDGQPPLGLHDRVEATYAEVDSATGHHRERDPRGHLTGAVGQPVGHGPAGKGGQRAQCGLPADQQAPGHQDRQQVAADAERRTGQDERRCVALLTGQRRQPDEQERGDHAEQGDQQALGEVDAHAEHVAAPAHGQHGYVGRAPGPEETAGFAVAFRLGDHVDSVELDPRLRAALAKRASNRVAHGGILGWGGCS